MANIYLAARYSRFPEMQKVREDLNEIGHSVTSRWINGGHELTKEGSSEASAVARTKYAMEDMSDLRSANYVISFTEEPRTTKTRGGRHVEFGLAIALNLRIIVVGFRENVFHTLHQVEFFSTWEECLTILTNEIEGK